MKKLRLFFVAVLLLSYALPALTEAASYTLSNGDSFVGTQKEYQYAELLISIQADLPDIVAEAWEKSSKKTKFPSLDKILAKTKVTGSATYNKNTKTFTITNTKPGRATIEVRHNLSRSKVNKIIANFIKEVEAILPRYEKQAGIAEDAFDEDDIDEDSDLSYIVDSYIDDFYDIGENLSLGLMTSQYDIEGQTNNTGVTPVLLYAYVGKNDELDVEDKTEYYYQVESKFSEEIFSDHLEFPYKSFYMNFELDDEAKANSTVTFKVTDIRALSTLKAEDIWVDLFTE